MKLLLSFIVFSLFISSPEWLTDFNKAQQEASKNNKLILLNFSGSDWCGPCIRLKKDVFEADVFSEYAAENLVLVSADFPRLKKNQLSKEQTMLNETLADKYNKSGKFPFTVLLNSNGKVLKEWDGLPKESPQQFIDEIKKFINVGS